MQHQTQSTETGLRSKRLYVSSLPVHVEDSVLAEHFSQFGKIADCQVVRDKRKGWSRGFGFVTFETEDDAAAAVKSPTIMFRGHELKVELSQSVGPYPVTEPIDGSNPLSPTSRGHLASRLRSQHTSQVSHSVSTAGPFSQRAPPLIQNFHQPVSGVPRVSCQAPSSQTSPFQVAPMTSACSPFGSVHCSTSMILKDQTVVPQQLRQQQQFVFDGNHGSPAYILPPHQPDKSPHHYSTVSASYSTLDSFQNTAAYHGPPALPMSFKLPYEQQHAVATSVSPSDIKMRSVPPMYLPTPMPLSNNTSPNTSSTPSCLTPSTSQQLAQIVDLLQLQIQSQQHIVLPSAPSQSKHVSQLPQSHLDSTHLLSVLMAAMQGPHTTSHDALNTLGLNRFLGAAALGGGISDSSSRPFVQPDLSTTSSNSSTSSNNRLGCGSAVIDSCNLHHNAYIHHQYPGQHHPHGLVHPHILPANLHTHYPQQPSLNPQHYYPQHPSLRYPLTGPAGSSGLAPESLMCDFSSMQFPGPTQNLWTPVGSLPTHNQ